jgi:hypothetical protein
MRRLALAAFLVVAAAPWARATAVEEALPWALVLPLFP